MKARRAATLAIIAWSVLMVGWTATYLGGVGSCVTETGWQLAVCEAGRSIGIEFGFPLILAVWFLGTAAIGLVWLRGRSAHR
jgi:hypothetical protein